MVEKIIIKNGREIKKHKMNEKKSEIYKTEYKMKH